MRKYCILFLLSALAVAISVILLAGMLIRSSPAWKMSHFICSYPGYTRLSNGMTATRVEEILGKPSRQIQADDENRKYYCSFDHYPEAAQCW